MTKTGSVFAALADPTRRAILESLRNGGQTAGAVADQFNVSWPAISRHLRVLKAAGLVWETRDGRNRYYEVNSQALSPVIGWLNRFPTDAGRLAISASFVPSAVGREYTS